MKMGIKMLLWSVVLICCCTGSAYASSVAGMELSFDPAPPFWPGEQVRVTATVEPVQAGAYVLLQSEHAPGFSHGYFASGYTDINGKFSGVYTVPTNALDYIKYSSQHGSICFTGICPSTGDPDFPLANNIVWAQSLDIYCKIVPSTAVPEFPSVVVPVAAVLGLVVIFGRRKSIV